MEMFIENLNNYLYNPLEINKTLDEIKHKMKRKKMLIDQRMRLKLVLYIFR